MSFHVYILSNRARGTLYIGVTHNLARRVHEHREKEQPSFSEKYNLIRLVFYEEYPTADEAIRRKKAMKKWNRAWKIRAVEEMNPDWGDLYLKFNE